MKTFFAMGFGVLTLALGLGGCSSDSANPGPTIFDSGLDRSAPKQTDSGSGSKSDTGTPKGDGATPDATTTPDATATQDGGLIDGSLPDVGSCTSDATACNSCFTPAQNPLNGCSPATVNCIPFDNARVPSGAP